MFSRPVREVAATRIFARHLDGGEQALVYSMNVGLTEPTAMILPLPVPPGPAEDAVRFVDLSGYSGFFEHLHAAFPKPPVARGGGFAARMIPEADLTLKVHRVGSFIASFVPSRADFTRLDDRFRLSDDIWDALPYDDWGFAVFQLASKRGMLARITGGVAKQTIHPMAFVFPRRDPRTLFFPTLHVHDGAVHPAAEFDHQLYCQPDPITAASFTWRKSSDVLGTFVDASKAQSLIDPEAPAFMHSILGNSHNRDITLTPPDITLEALRPRHRWFALELSAFAAYFDETSAEPAATQRRIALHHLEEVGSTLCARVEALLDAQRSEWRLAEHDDAALEHMMSSVQTMDGHAETKLTAPGQPLPFGPGWKAPTGRGRLRFGVHHTHMPHVGVHLTFAELPTSEICDAIQRALFAVVEETWQQLQLS